MAFGHSCFLGLMFFCFAFDCVCWGGKVLDEHMQPFKRIWCIFEVWRLKQLQKPLELSCDLGLLGLVPDSLDEAQHQQVSQRLLHASREAQAVSARFALSSVQEDKLRIWREIADAPFQPLMDQLGSEAFLHTTTNYFTNFDAYVQKLLCESVLECLLAAGQQKAAREICLRKAHPSEHQLERICRGFQSNEERERWLGEMLISSASTAETDGSLTQMLLQHGADVESTNINGCTALMAAVQGGGEAAVNVLLAHGAHAATASKSGDTALIRAAHMARPNVVKLLIDHAAHVLAADSNGLTALMAAVHSGHESTTRLLLEHGADVMAYSGNGDTALSCAARGGHVAIATLLLRCRADVEAADDEGGTPIMRAAQGGHASLVQLLLDHRADARATNKVGVTALMLAAQSGCQSVVAALLSNGAEAGAESNAGLTALSAAFGTCHESVVPDMLEKLPDEQRPIRKESRH